MNSTHHATRSFLRFNIEQHILQKRWLILVPVVLFAAYIMSDEMLVVAKSQGLSPNIWNPLFNIFGNGNAVFWMFNFLFLFLISDLSVETGFGALLLFRLRSRSKWWLAKVLTLAVAALAFAGMLLVLVGGVSSFAFPWSTSWSELARGYAGRIGPNPAVLVLSPSGAFLRLITLLILGWFSLGLVTTLVSSLTNNGIVGFLAGAVINIAGLFAYKGYIPRYLQNYSIATHFLLDFHRFGTKASMYPPFGASIIYWAVWIALFTTIGFLLCRKKDFLSEKDRS
ncbi:hypothetical protein [Candidatus Cryosericum odellii]|uniref:Uncharacterized protein n=1 Tax=Candidatus Cryosericum odellii TaxID=2290917 RepID=A0A398D473_9BACT|nr:hypothetical protein [Candidatus Cryosericum odellii]RIE09300.1 hypothetical protein SMC6_03005 [Candidatus Cryosericum odellii]RIE12922.1 hypothetical protein SMC5_03215 [Candidatus Cryosericum odellii]